MIARRQLIASFGALGALAIAGTAAGQAPGLQGRWNAVIEAGAQKLRIELLIRPDGGVVLYSLDQGGASFPAEAVSLSADRIEITVPAAQATFSGRLAGGDRLEGAWKQGGGALPLVFTRGAAAALAAAPVASPLTTERLSEIRRAAAAPGLIAAAQKRGRRANVWVSGERELGSGMLVTQVDRWHIGSITKSMTATLVARLVESGRLSWDQTLESALGETAPQMRAEYKGVTLRHLLSHRSGLPAHIPLPELLRFSRDSVDARGERRAYAQTALAMTPEGAPGAKFVYSHSGYVVAGLMIERELGVPWEVALERYIFQPLRLHSAGFGAPHKSANPLGHNLDALDRLRAAKPGVHPTDNPTVLGPAGGVHMSMRDLLAYLGAHRDGGPLLKRGSWQALHTPPFGGDYAMGWIVRPDGALWHNGSNTLWHAEAMFHRDNGIAAAAVANDGRTPTASPAVSTALAAAAAAA